MRGVIYARFSSSGQREESIDAQVRFCREYADRHKIDIISVYKDEAKEARIKDFDAEYEHPTKYSSGRGSYVERNQAMIDDSDICVFYYDENYLPLRRKNSPRDISDYQPKSGTRIAYEYAIKKESV